MSSASVFFFPIFIGCDFFRNGFLCLHTKVHPDQWVERWHDDREIAEDDDIFFYFYMKFIFINWLCARVSNAICNITFFLLLLPLLLYFHLSTCGEISAEKYFIFILYVKLFFIFFIFPKVSIRRQNYRAKQKYYIFNITVIVFCFHALKYPSLLFGYNI